MLELLIEYFGAAPVWMRQGLLYNLKILIKLPAYCIKVLSPIGEMRTEAGYKTSRLRHLKYIYMQHKRLIRAEHPTVLLYIVRNQTFSVSIFLRNLIRNFFVSEVAYHQ